MLSAADPATDFLRLQDILLPPPFPALAAILLVLGLWKVGRILTVRLQGTTAGLEDHVAGFVLAVGLVGGIVHGFACAGFAGRHWLAALALVLAGAGLSAVPAVTIAARQRIREFAWRDGSLLGRVGLVFSGVTLLGLLLAAAGPVTDADSLDYHIGVPLAWLRAGTAYPTPDWFHSRLVGLGEALNLLGLSAGTDGLGAMVQACGLLLVVLLMAAQARSLEDRTLGFLLVITVPMLAFLVPNQKPQLFAAAATTAGLTLIVKRRETLDNRTLALALGCVAIAMGCRYSSFLSGGPVLCLALVAGVRAGRTRAVIGWAALSLLVFVAPVGLRNLAFYGDPLSPFLERWRSVPNAAVVAFADGLRDFEGARAVSNLLWLPVRFSVTVKPGDLSTVLGLGVLSVFAATWSRRDGRWFLGSAALAGVSLLAFGQLAARFFLEPYLWCAAGAVAAEWTARKRLLRGLLVAQSAVVAGAACFLAVSLAPGAVTRSLREAVMTRCAAGYTEARWLDRVLPRDAVLVADSRWNALWPRPFVSADHLWWSLGGSPDRLTPGRARGYLDNRGATAILMKGLDKANVLARALGQDVGFSSVTASFRLATRNPFNRGQPYTVTLILITRK